MCDRPPIYFLEMSIDSKPSRRFFVRRLQFAHKVRLVWLNGNCSGSDAPGCGGVAVGHKANGIGGGGGVSIISDAVSIGAGNRIYGGAGTSFFMCVSLLLRRASVSTITNRRCCSRMRSGWIFLIRGRWLFRLSHPIRRNGKLQRNLLLRVFQFTVFGR